MASNQVLVPSHRGRAILAALAGLVTLTAFAAPRAFAVGANGKRSAYVLAVDDDGGLCGITGHDRLSIGVVDNSFDLANVTELDGSRSLLLGVAPSILDEHKGGMGGNLAVKVRRHFPVIARRVKALVALHIAKQ